MKKIRNDKFWKWIHITDCLFSKFNILVFFSFLIFSSSIEKEKDFQSWSLLVNPIIFGEVVKH